MGNDHNHRSQLSNELTGYVRRRVAVQMRPTKEPESVSAHKVTWLPISVVRQWLSVAQRQIDKYAERIRANVYVSRLLAKLSRHQRRAILIATAVIVVASSLFPLFSAHTQAANYDLSKAKSVLGTTPSDLQSKLKYDSTQKAWTFNAGHATKSADSLNVGALAYSAQLPTSLSTSRGLVMTDTNSKLDITLKPQFSLHDGQSKQGHVVYPLVGSNAQLVYSFKNDGVKEDIVLYQSPGDTADFSYQLQLPEGMAGRVQKDGSIGVYGGDTSLYSNISYGSNKDKTLVNKARQHSKKDHLYYAIPAPTITGNGTSKVHAKFLIKDDTLTVRVKGLAGAHYPLSIDPSFVMTLGSACAWNAGNNEGTINYSGCKISRNTLSGGSIGAWNTTSPMVVDYYATQVVVSNGYMYVLGGKSDTGSSVASVQYAQINSDGTVGAFHYTHNSTDDSTTYVSGYNTAHVNDFRAAAYNGYLYVVGGANNQPMTATVDYAKLNANGTVGTWSTSANQMGTTRASFGLQVYGGYMYAYGGCTSLNVSLQCITYSSNLEQAPIKGNGDIGPWSTSANTMSTTRVRMASAIYNGNLYALGGCVSYLGGGGSCNTTLASVEYAHIDPTTGAIGNWTLTSSFTNARHGLSAVAYNGYLYMFGGQFSSTIYGDTQLAKIYANGSIGPWQSATALAGNRMDMGAAAYNGYLYTAGGCNSAGANCNSNGGQSEVRYAAISTPGGTSAYSAETNFDSAGRTAFATVAYGGYVYVVGGTTGNTGGASTMLNTLRYAPINPDGSLGTWTTSSTGFNNVDGYSLCTTAGSCPGRVNMAAGVYNGYLYIAGGVSNGSANQWSDVQSTPLNPTTGAPGTWTTLYTDYLTNSTTTYTEANGRSQVAMQIYNGTMYLIGGFNSGGGTNGTNYADIYYSTLTPTGGTGNFTHSAVSLPSLRAGVKAFVQSGRLYIVGGGSGQGWGSIATGSDADDVQFIPIKSDGTLDGSVGWKDANAAVNGGSGSSFVASGTLGDYGVTVSNGYVYISGGQNGGGANTFSAVYKAKINANGSLGSWSTTTSITTPRYSAGSVAVNGYLYIIAGCTAYNGFVGINCNSVAQMPTTYQYAQIYNNGGGSDGTWGSLNTLPASVTGNMGVAANGYLYSMGGCTGFQTIVFLRCTGLPPTVNYAKINNDGTVGSWTATSAMVDGDYLGGAVTYAGRIYVIGGCNAINTNACNVYSNGVQYATICTGVNLPVAGCSGAGAVSAWQYTYNNTNAPTYTAGNGFNGLGRWYVTAAVSNSGYVYIAGGANGVTNITDATQVQYAKINAATGTMGPWTNTSLYTTSRIGPGLAVNGNYVYMTAGTTQTSGTALHDVQYALMNADGSLGAWSVTAGLPIAVGSASSGVSNGYLYVWGGSCDVSCTAANGYVTNLQYAPLYADGSIGRWTVTKGMGSAAGAVGHTAFGGVIANGYVYALGGAVYTATDSSHLASDNNAYYAPLQAAPQIAHYSMQLTTDYPTAPANFFGVTSPESTNSSISLGLAWAIVSSPTFSSTSTTSNIASATKYNLTISSYGTNYYWVPITIDDSQSMTIDETSGSNMSYLQINYHPAPNMRLHGGKTFNGNVLQSLDAS